MLVLSALVACQQSGGEGSDSTIGGQRMSVPDLEGTVTWIYDGDTIVVAPHSGGDIDVRLLGINAPDEGECFYGESLRFMIDEIKDSEVALTDTSLDTFDRTLAHVWAGLEHVNLTLVSRGLAIATTPDDTDALGESLIRAESTASRSGAGLWADDACGAEGPLPQVAVERIESDPRGPDDSQLEHELIGLVNAGDTDIDMSGWVLRDESSRHRYRFPAGTHLSSGATLSVTSADPGWDPGGSPVWNNGGDLVMLLDQTGRVVTASRY